MRKIHKIFKSLIGTWMLDRTIQGYGNVEGIAQFKFKKYEPEKIAEKL